MDWPTMNGQAVEMAKQRLGVGGAGEDGRAGPVSKGRTNVVPVVPVTRLYTEGWGGQGAPFLVAVPPSGGAETLGLPLSSQPPWTGLWECGQVT